MRAVKLLDKGLYPNAFCKILPDVFDQNPAYCMCQHVDTAGSKTALAYLYWRETGDLRVWQGIVQDALVMNIDDLACAGFVDKFIVTSNIARNKQHIPGEVLETIIHASDRFIEKLRQWGAYCAFGGGETADVGDVVRTIDIGYTVTARMPRFQVIENAIQPQDVIIGFASYGQSSYETEYNSGIGCNGLTSARHDLFKAEYRTLYPETYEPNLDPSVVYSGSYSVEDPVEGFDLNIGQLALSPTRTYLPLLRDVYRVHLPHIHGVIHCTGGGQTKCMRFINDLHVIKDNLLPVPPIFRLIQQVMPTPWREMFKTFNMGHRLEIYCPRVYADDIIAIAKDHQIEAQIVGRCVEGPNKLTIRHDGHEYVY